MRTGHVFSWTAAGTCLCLALMLSCGGKGSHEQDATDIPGDEIQEPVGDTDALEAVPDQPDTEEPDMPEETPVEWEGIHCGGNTCSGSQVCCFEHPYYYAHARCADPSDCSGHVMECDGADDCGSGETCCVADPSYPASACQTASCDKVICHIDGECPSPQLCCPHPFIGHIRDQYTPSPIG